MQIEASVQSPESAMLDDISQSLESALVLVTGGNRMALGSGAVLLVCHQNRDLRAELGQLERTCVRDSGYQFPARSRRSQGNTNTREMTKKQSSGKAMLTDTALEEAACRGCNWRQLGKELPWRRLTSYQCYARARCRAGSPECCHGPKVGEGPLGRHLADDVDAKVLVQPIAGRWRRKRFARE
jgi:hypothetical protein